MHIPLPDKNQCKTRYLYDQLWECHVEDSLVCPFCMDLGSEYFCLHHDSDMFSRA